MVKPDVSATSAVFSVKGGRGDDEEDGPGQDSTSVEEGFGRTLSIENSYAVNISEFSGRTTTMYKHFKSVKNLMADALDQQQ